MPNIIVLVSTTWDAYIEIWKI